MQNNVFLHSWWCVSNNSWLWCVWAAKDALTSKQAWQMINAPLFLGKAFPCLHFPPLSYKKLKSFCHFLFCHPSEKLKLYYIIPNFTPLRAMLSSYFLFPCLLIHFYQNHRLPLFINTSVKLLKILIIKWTRKLPARFNKWYAKRIMLYEYVFI